MRVGRYEFTLNVITHTRIASFSFESCLMVSVGSESFIDSFSEEDDDEEEEDDDDEEEEEGDVLLVLISLSVWRGVIPGVFALVDVSVFLFSSSML